MVNKKLSRRDFLRISGASAALMASGMNIQSLLRAAPANQDVTNIVFGGWGATAEDNGVQAAIQAFQERQYYRGVAAYPRRWRLYAAAADEFCGGDCARYQLHHSRCL
mgnify:CR=1 FL=1